MRSALSGAILFLTLAACGPARPPNAVPYQVTFQGTWTAESHPLDYPSGAALDPGSAHFSGIIGAAHDASYALFAVGALASPGLVALSHTGAHSPLDAELTEVAEAGHAAPQFGTGIFLDVNSPQTEEFDASEEFPLVSLVTMVAPSSDWFVGVASLDLRPNGEWLEEVTVSAFAYDSGAYQGETYRVDEVATSPAQPVSLNQAPPFLVGDARPPVAQVTFSRVYER